MKYLGIHIVCILLFTSFGCALLNSGTVKNGEMAYERKQYALAAEMLTEEYESKNHKKLRSAYLAKLIGKSYANIGETDKTVEWIEKSIQHEYDLTLISELAYAYKKRGNYRAAIGKYQELKREVTGRDRELDREINICKEIQKWKQDDHFEYKVHVHPSSSSASDYGIINYKDDQLVFTSDREDAAGDTYNWTGRKHTDLYIGSKKGNRARKFDAPINTKYNEGTACFTRDFSEMYFTRCTSDSDQKDAYCKIMYSQNVDGLWSDPTPLKFIVDGYNYGHPTLIERDSVMIFSANLPEGLGKHDLFYSECIPVEGGGHYWSAPSPMPSSINTQGEELFPTADGDTLYFSSDYHPGYGGLDIFMTYLDADRRWSKPKNILQPINSSEDDHSFIIDHNALLRGNVLEKGYFSSSRSGYGSDDILRYDKIKIISTKEKEETPDEKTVDSTIYLINLAVKTISAGVPLSGTIILLKSEDDTQELKTDGSGLLISAIERNKNYTISAQKTGYLNSIKTFDTYGLQYKKGELSKTINKTLSLEKIEYDKEIVLNNIYYDFNKSNIRVDARPVLDSLAMLLTNNPQINIELTSHTDCRGDDDYNMILSQKRAQSAVDYIISNGIKSTQITARGYGETAPVQSCICDNCTEEEHQQNRRTSFKIKK